MAPAPPVGFAQAAAAGIAPVVATVRVIVAGFLGAIGLGPLAAAAPVAPAQPPAPWALLAWARREFDRTFSFGKTASASSTPVTTAAVSTTAAAATTAVAPDPTTIQIGWLTGPGSLNSTAERFGVYGTDLGIMWDNGIADDPGTSRDERQVLIAFGDTFSGAGMTGIWRSNVLFRSADNVLSDGLYVPDGDSVAPIDVFAGSPMTHANFSRQVILSPGYLGPLGSEVTIIPTAGVAVPNGDGTARQYVNFMSVKSWDVPGRWTTNYSAIAYSDDNGQTWTFEPSTMRAAGLFRTSTGYVPGNQNFQQAAYVRGDDGYVYAFGTPAGRGGSAYVSRVAEDGVLDVTKYEYWDGSSWVPNQPSAAVAVIGSGNPGLLATIDNFTGGLLSGLLGSLLPGVFAANGGNVSELSVQYNNYLDKYVVMYADQYNNVVIRTADRPEGPWSDPTTVVTSAQYPGLYAPMIHPWSSTGELEKPDGGTENPQYLYWNMSLWGDYNVKLMRTDLGPLMV